MRSLFGLKFASRNRLHVKKLALVLQGIEWVHGNVEVVNDTILMAYVAEVLHKAKELKNGTLPLSCFDPCQTDLLTHKYMTLECFAYPMREVLRVQRALKSV